MRRLLLCLLLLVLLPANPGTAAAGRSVPAFERFVQNSGWTCRKSPAPKCIAAGFSFADSNGDQRLSQAEIEELRQDYAAWIAWKRPQLSTRHRIYASLADRIARELDPGLLVESYDADGDGLLTGAEILTDVSLDQRPLRQVLLDPGSINWQGVSERFGGLALLLRTLGSRALGQGNDGR